MLTYMSPPPPHTHTHTQGYVPQYSHRPDYKRNGKPVDITTFVRESPSHINDVILYWNPDMLYPQVSQTSTALE